MPQDYTTFQNIYVPSSGRVHLTNNYRHKWDSIIAIYGPTCVYCYDQPATQIDHVIPRSWKDCNHISNLRPCCSWCNLHAGSQVFDTFDEKYDFLRKERARRRHLRYKRTVCTSCLLPYQRPLHSPNMFLCAECYDDEYDKMYRKKKPWIEWLELCKTAGFLVEAHRALAGILRLNRSISIPAKDKARLLAIEYSMVDEFEIEW